MSALRVAKIEVSPAFHDVDVMEIVWHGNYVKYFELARTELLRGLGYDYPAMRDSGYAWPVVDLAVRYSRPAHYGQKLIVSAKLVEWENRMKISYRIHDAASGDMLSKGHTVQVAVEIATQQMCYVSPDVLFEKLGIDKP